MIHDTIENFTRYTALNPRFEKVAKWLAETNLDSLSIGQHQILPDGEAFVNVQELTPRPKTEMLAECHRKYIDVQIPLSGPEQMGWQPLADLPKEVPFSTENDAALAKLPTDDWITVRPGEFVVFFPSDVHTPGLVTGSHKKMIIKVLN